jgi:hypothetical protein
VYETDLHKLMDDLVKLSSQINTFKTSGKEGQRLMCMLETDSDSD